MKIHTSDKAIAYITLLSGLTISAVAIYYSVAGLTAIFAAAVMPIIVMGIALEISKLAATVWLKQNWSRAPNFIRGYLLAAIAILMVITSMGIFGFLSKAHSDQSLVSGDVQSKIAVYDEKIRTSKDNIEANRKALKQMDEAVDQVMGRSSDEKGADKAVALRKSQQKERSRLLSEIQAEQKTISQISEERAPIAAEVRKVEAEVGPIKYIAAFIYGDNPDANVLEKAVTWVIIIIVSVFDPLAVILLLASQYSFMWFRKQQDEDEEVELLHETVPLAANDNIAPVIVPEVDINEVNAMLAEVPKEEPTLESVGVEPVIEYKVEDADDEIPVLENEETWTQRVIDETPLPEIEEDNNIVESAHETEKQAMKAWKQDHPESSLKIQKHMFEKGIINKLPWEDYLKPEADFAAEEAKKWADEHPEAEEAKEAKEWAQEKILTAGLDERPGDYISDPAVTYMENVEGQQVKKVIDGYTQNAEQGDGTLWKRIQDAKK